MFQNPSTIKMELQSLDGILEACLCINEQRMCIAVFDKNSPLSNPNMELLKSEFNKILLKIQKLMNTELINYNMASKAIIKTHSSCDRLKMSDWISNYA